MQRFLKKWWDAVVAILFLALIMLFALIGIWTGNDQSGYTAYIMILPAFVFGAVTIGRHS